MAIKFNHKKYSRTIVKNNILKVYHQATPEECADWYCDAYDFCYETSGVLLDLGIIKPYTNGFSRFVGVVAALSPLKSWEQNKKLAIDFFVTGTCGHMGANILKSELIRDCSGRDDEIMAILNGEKTKNFYHNIKYPNMSEKVTVDRHALSIAVGEYLTEDKMLSMSVKQYEFFAECYRYTARRLNISPSRLQGTTWSTWRRIKKNYKNASISK